MSSQQKKKNINARSVGSEEMNNSTPIQSQENQVGTNKECAHSWIPMNKGFVLCKKCEMIKWGGN